MILAEELREFLISQGIADKDRISISRKPTIKMTEDDQWAIVSQGGIKAGGNMLKWKRRHVFILLYRNKRGEDLYHSDELLMGIEGCIKLNSFKVLQAVINPMTDEDTGQNEVHIGKWQLNIDVIAK